jgi:hypothetical protein
LIAASIGSIWYLLPTNGKVHHVATMPVLEDVIPIGIIIGLTMGIAMIFSLLRN